MFSHVLHYYFNVIRSNHNITASETAISLILTPFQTKRN